MVTYVIIEHVRFVTIADQIIVIYIIIMSLQDFLHQNILKHHKKNNLHCFTWKLIVGEGRVSWYARLIDTGSLIVYP